MESVGFVHLHTHSHFSATGLASPRALVERAARLGMKALALTDHNSLAGFFPFLDACESHGIKPLIGCELSILPHDARRYQKRVHHLTLLAESEKGYRNLCRLVSLAHREGGPSSPYVKFEQFSEHCSDLIALTGCARSELFALLSKKKADETEKYLTRLARVVGVNNIYFEIQDRGHPLQKEVNTDLLELAEFLEFPTVITHNVHYLDQLDSIAHACLCGEPPDDSTRAAAWGQGIKTSHFASAGEMFERFNHLRDAFSNTARIAERCDGALIPKGDLYPVLTFPRGEDARSFLWRECFEAAPRRFGQLDENLKKQINEGYDDIIREGLAAHLVFLFRAARHLDAKGLPRGPGRGQLITNPISYVLGLSQIDPKLYPFVRQPWRAVGERFPLLELEVPERASDCVRQHLRDTYGPGSVAEIGFFSLPTRKNIFREICAWAGLTEAEADSMFEEFPAKSDLIAAREEVRALPPDEHRAQNPKVLAFIFALLQTRPVGPQSGSGRFVVSAGPLDDIVALTHTEDSPLPLTTFDDDALDRLGLPRFQLLHPPLLETLDQILRWASADHLQPLRLDQLPLDENTVFDLLNQGKTNGIEPFWSITTKAILRDANPRTLPQLVKCYADAHRRRRRANPGDLLDHVPRCLMGYWIAYFKALYPVSFWATILSRTYQHHRAFPILLREALAQGIVIRPPDINDSAYEFSQLRDQLQAGLMVVRGVGERIHSEISRARGGGRFDSFQSFCEAINPQIVRHAVLANLIGAGALDCFGLHRSQLLAVLEHALEVSRRSHPPDAGDATFFGLASLNYENRTREFDLPDLPEFPPEKKAALEIETIGFSLTQDPLLAFKPLLKIMRPHLPEQITPKLIGKEIWLAGFADRLEDDGPHVEPPSFAAILDLEGLPVSLHEGDLASARRVLEQSGPILVRGIVERRNGGLYLKSSELHSLADIQEKSSQTSQLIIALADIERKKARDLSSLFKAYPGISSVVVKGAESPPPSWVKRIQSFKVLVCPPLLADLRSLIGSARIETEGGSSIVES